MLKVETLNNNPFPTPIIEDVITTNGVNYIKVISDKTNRLDKIGEEYYFYNGGLQYHLIRYDNYSDLKLEKKKYDEGFQLILSTLRFDN